MHLMQQLKDCIVCQDDDVDNDDPTPAPPLFGPPCDLLRDSGALPNMLSLAGHLVLQSCNLWMGCVNNDDNDGNTATGRKSHSGLRHDFHDNFCCLVAGCKCFCLHAPSNVFFGGLPARSRHIMPMV